MPGKCAKLHRLSVRVRSTSGFNKSMEGPQELPQTPATLARTKQWAAQSFGSFTIRNRCHAPANRYAAASATFIYIYIIYVRIMYICIYLFNMYLKRFVMVTEKDLSDLLAFKWSSSWSQKHSLLSFHGFHPTQTDWHPFEFSWRESFLQRQRMTSGPQKHITTWQIPTHQPGFLLVVSPKKNSGYEKPKVIFGELGWSYIYIHYFPGNPEKKNIYIYISLANSDWN